MRPEFIILLPEKLRKMLKEKAVETGYLPDELNTELAPEDLLTHYQFHEYV